MSIRQVGIANYFSALPGVLDGRPGRRSLAILVPPSGPGGSSVVTEPRIKPGADLPRVTLAFG